MYKDAILEKWKQYESYHDILDNQQYIVEVLGIELPINESGHVAYTPLLRKQIIEEHLLLEGWWDGFKKNVKSYPDTVKMLYKAVTGEKLHTFMKAINWKGLKIKDKVMKFLDWVLEKTANSTNAVLQKLNKWSENIKSAVEKSLKWINDISKPWMKALGLTALAVGLNYVWSKISAYASDLMGCGDEEGGEESGEFDSEVAGSIKDTISDCLLGKATEFLKDQATKLAGDSINKLKDAGASIMSGGISTFWKWLVAFGKGVKFVVNSLDDSLEFFKKRGGLSVDEGRTSLARSIDSEAPI
tara:strand:- start:1711 stop:2613 length:903 start_codon:yes stop_codon:yes gene_type:complete